MTSAAYNQVHFSLDLMEAKYISPDQTGHRKERGR